MSNELDIDYDKPAVLPDDDQAARERVDWHARMVRHYTAQRDEEIASYQREIDRLKAEIEHRKRTAQTHIDWHTAPIESYHRMRQEQDRDLRTLRTPHATSKITVPKTPVVNVAEGYDLTKQAVPIFTWLRDHHPNVLKLPGISEIRKLVDVVDTYANDAIIDRIVVDKDTGEVLPFLVAEVPPLTYKLTPEEGAPL